MNMLIDYYIEREKLAGKDLLADLENEREVMGKVLSRIKSTGCKEWYYGHYHESYMEEKENIVFRCVATQEMYNI